MIAAVLKRPFNIGIEGKIIWKSNKLLHTNKGAERCLSVIVNAKSKITHLEYCLKYSFYKTVFKLNREVFF